MTKLNSEMIRPTKSLHTVKNSKNIFHSFYSRSSRGKDDRHFLAWCMSGISVEILTAFDLPLEWPENFGALCASRQVAVHFIEIAEAEGFSTELCSYLTNSLGYCRQQLELGEVPPESPVPNGMGNPTLMLGSGLACDPRWKWLQIIASRYFNRPVFNLDPMSPPYDIDISDPRIKDHYLDQLRTDYLELVKFLEQQTGNKLNMNRLRDILANSQKALKLWYAVLQLRKSIPCPMGSVDYFSAIIPQMYMLGTEESITFYQLLYDEVKHRVNQNIGVIPQEKYRLMWLGIPPWFNLGLFNYLETLGAVFPLELTYIISPPQELDLEDPIEAIVQRTWKHAEWLHKYGSEVMPESCNPSASTGFCGSRLLHQWVNDYKIDGAIMHRSRSCRASSVGQIHYKRLLDEKGVPTLILESDMADPRSWSDSKIKTLLETFLETIEGNRS